MKNRDNLKIRFKKDNTLTIIITSAIIVVIMIVGVKLGASSVYATSGDAISEISHERQNLVEKNKQLETEIAQDQSLPNVEKIAHEKLGMIKAKPVIYLSLSSSK